MKAQMEKRGTGKSKVIKTAANFPTIYNVFICLKSNGHFWKYVLLYTIISLGVSQETQTKNKKPV